MSTEFIRTWRIANTGIQTRPHPTNISVRVVTSIYTPFFSCLCHHLLPTSFIDSLRGLFSPLGTQMWVEGVELVLLSGYRLDAPDSIPVPLLTPGQATDMSILLRSPDIPGMYEGRWRLCTRDRRLFGGDDNNIICSLSLSLSLSSHCLCYDTW